MFWMVAALVLVMVAFINVVISASPDGQRELGTLGAGFHQSDSDLSGHNRLSDVLRQITFLFDL